MGRIDTLSLFAREGHAQAQSAGPATGQPDNHHRVGRGCKNLPLIHRLPPLVLDPADALLKIQFAAIVSGREGIEKSQAKIAQRLIGIEGGRNPQHGLPGQGIRFRVARLWHGDRGLERRLKDRKDAPQLCPICGRGYVVGYAEEVPAGEIDEHLLAF